MQQQQQPQVAAAFAHNSMVQTIQNPDGTMSIIHIDTGPGGDTPQIVTLADGTQAQVVHAVSVVTVMMIFPFIYTLKSVTFDY